jgi:transposase
MLPPRFIPEFKDEAVRQITGRGYSVAEVSARLGVSAQSLYKCVSAVKPDKTDQQANDLIAAKSEILRLRAQLHRTKLGECRFCGSRWVAYAYPCRAARPKNGNCP